MPKKGSRIASSQAKSQERARRKAHAGGPVLPAAAYQPPVSESAETGIAAAEATEAAAAPSAAQAASAPAVRRSAPSARREHAAVAAVAATNVRNELLKVASFTAVAGVALTVLKLFTDIGA